MKACIIGGGIIGLSTAWYLRESGWDVTVLEKSDLSDNCSFGNMGYLSPSHIIPLAAPGMIEQGITWMFNAKSPFYVRPKPSWQLIDWGLKFMRSCTRAHVERSAKPLTELLLLSEQLFFEWQHSGALHMELEKKGCIMYFQTTKKEKEERYAAQLAEQHGLEVEMIDREKARQLEPDLQPDVAGGVWFKDDAHLYPNALMQQLPRVLEQRGVQILRHSEVRGFRRQNGRVDAVLYQNAQGQEQEIQADTVVLAAGSWSPQLARLAGEYIPLMPGKGYSMTVENTEKQLNYPCILLEAKVALTPWQRRLRIGSTMEIGPINDRILPQRVKGILEAVPRFFPAYAEDRVFRGLSERVFSGDLQRENWQSPGNNFNVWFGFRPVSADGMPYIGFAKKNQNLILATGHAMLGLSMGAGTGKLVAELANGQPTSIGMQAFDPRRF
jgi:D-amino-acid dehydrogenase